MKRAVLSIRAVMHVTKHSFPGSRAARTRTSCDLSSTNSGANVRPVN
jgi:hypothetical protein